MKPNFINNYFKYTVSNSLRKAFFIEEKDFKSVKINPNSTWIQPLMAYISVFSLRKFIA